MSDAAETMNVLNEAASHFPDASSFLAGRPPDSFLDTRVITMWLERFASATGESDIWAKLGQYSDTNGIVLDLLSQYLVDSGQKTTAIQHCMVTNGAQEGMLIALKGLCDGSQIALAGDPSYVGFVGAARIAGVHVETVVEDDQFVPRLIQRLELRRPRIRCLYLIPDYSNPTGRLLTLEDRLRIVDVARRTNTVILEDIAYRYYRYEGNQLPTLYSLSGGENVVLLESFSKTIFPGLRIGVLATQARDKNGALLIKKLSQIKSYSSVTTSPLNQAALGGFLLTHGRDISRWVEPRVSYLKGNRNTMLEALAVEFREQGGISWNQPQGGFFLWVRLGRSFDMQDCVTCAAQAKVLVMPMRLFSITQRFDDCVRLAFSNTPPDAIAPALARLAKWLNHH